MTLVDPATDLASGDGVSLALVDPLYFDASGKRIAERKREDRRGKADMQSTAAMASTRRRAGD